MDILGEHSLGWCYRKHVVFGEVLKGQDVVDAIEAQEVDNKTRPISEVRISNCGELVLQKSMYRRWKLCRVG